MNDRVESVYSKVLSVCAVAGFIFFLAVYALYVFGMVSPYIPLEKVAAFWHLDAETFLKNTGNSPGWAWLRNVSYSDNMCLLAVVFLGMIVTVCYLSILPLFIKQKDHIYVVIVIMQIMIIIFAASGIVH